MIMQFSGVPAAFFEIARMWQMETETVPVVIGTLGVKFQAEPASISFKQLLF